MATITHRAFSRSADRFKISFAETRTEDYQNGELINKSSGGMSFISDRELKPGSGIMIKLVDLASETEGGTPKRDYLAEVRWCVRESTLDAPRYRVGVRIFTSTCALCGKEIHHGDTDAVDLCNECRNRFCSTSRGKVNTCVEKFLLGNVV